MWLREQIRLHNNSNTSTHTLCRGTVRKPRLEKSMEEFWGSFTSQNIWITSSPSAAQTVLQGRDSESKINLEFP